MINTLRIALLTILTLANLFLLAVSAYHWKTNKEKTAKIGFAFMAVLEIANIIVTGGSMLW